MIKSVALAACVVFGSSGGVTGPLFLVEEQSVPHALISWPTLAGQDTVREADIIYRTPEDRVPLGGNVSCFVAVGGVRLQRGAGHPDGAIVRVGFYKLDNAEPFFKDLRDNAMITIELTNVAFNQPPAPRPETTLQHCKYTPEDIASCGLSPGQIEQYNTASPTDDLYGVITSANGRLGALSGTRQGDGAVTLTVEDDGTVSMKAVFPYALLKHVRDPWLRTTPGTFFEPYHFHIEFEVLPAGVAAELDEQKGAPEDAPPEDQGG